jgi:flagellar FliL protein
MAEEEVKTSGEEVKTSGGMNIILILVVFLLFLVLVVAGGIAYMLMSSDDSEMMNEQKSAKMMDNSANMKQNSMSEDSQMMNEQKPMKAKMTRKKNYTNLGVLFPLDKVIVNLQTDGVKKRYLRVEISLEFDNPAMSEEANMKLPVIKDLIISILTSKSMEDVSTFKGKDRIKDEILSELSTVFVDGKVTDIFFTDFVIQ